MDKKDRGNSVSSFGGNLERQPSEFEVKKLLNIKPHEHLMQPSMSQEQSSSALSISRIMGKSFNNIKNEQFRSFILGQIFNKEGSLYYENEIEGEENNDKDLEEKIKTGQNIIDLE